MSDIYKSSENRGPAYHDEPGMRYNSPRRRRMSGRLAVAAAWALLAISVVGLALVAACAFKMHCLLP